MNPRDFRSSSAGKCIKSSGGYWAFRPNPLPPKIKLPDRLIQLLSKAERALGELSGTGSILPNPFLLINPNIRREAVASSRIEGTKASLNDLFFFEAAEVGKTFENDVIEVKNYVNAMNYGISKLKELPISIRLIRGIHKILMEGVGGQTAEPGEIRRSQNWIGPPGSNISNAAFVPPPVEEMIMALSTWEKYLHTSGDEPLLIQCALMHYQFEAIHPFLDGNGRVGRLLITFYLCDRGVLSQPLLYLSEYFNRFRNEYYQNLLDVSQKGLWNNWIEYFLRGVLETSQVAQKDARKIVHLHYEYQKKIREYKTTPFTTYLLIDEIFNNPVLSISGLKKKWNLPFNPIKRGINRLIKIGLLEEVTGRKRNKLFVAKDVLKLFSQNE